MTKSLISSENMKYMHKLDVKIDLATWRSIMTGNPHTDQTLPHFPFELGRKAPYKRIVDFPLEFKIRDEDKVQSLTDAIEWMIKHNNQKSFDALSRVMKVLEEGFVQKAVADNNDLCICEMSILMAEGCQCGGN